MRISDWSSDVCSSDLLPDRDRMTLLTTVDLFCNSDRLHRARYVAVCCRLARNPQPSSRSWLSVKWTSCRCQTARPVRCRCCWRSEEHTSELQSLMRISYAVFCLKKKTLAKD